MEGEVGTREGIQRGDRNGEMRERKKERDGEEKLEVFQARTFLHFQKQSSSEADFVKKAPAMFYSHFFLFFLFEGDFVLGG